MTKAEGGIGATTFGSGMAAIHAALLAAGLAPGAKLVAAKDLYGPTIGMLRTMFLPIGVEVALHDPVALMQGLSFVKRSQTSFMLRRPLILW